MSARFQRVFCAMLLASLSAELHAGELDCPPVLNHTVTTLLDEKPVSLCAYQGKVLLVVNTASFCGFTPQYQGLEALYSRYKNRGLVVVGFPSNDFGRQEPGSAKQIKEFCEATYNVRFPMYSKTVVSGRDASPFYKALATKSGSVPGWNFHKYLIDRKGDRVYGFTSRIEPEDQQLVAQIERLLSQ